MNKAELVSRMAEKSELTKKEAEMALNALMESIQEALVSGDKVQLVGFGTFETRERAARKGRNPRNPCSASTRNAASTAIPVWTRSAVRPSSFGTARCPSIPSSASAAPYVPKFARTMRSVPKNK